MDKVRRDGDDGLPSAGGRGALPSTEGSRGAFPMWEWDKWAIKMAGDGDSELMTAGPEEGRSSYAKFHR